jgi:flagellin
VGTDITLANSAGTISQTVSVSAGGTADFSELNVSFDVGADYAADDLDGATITVASSGSSGNTFQIGAENDANNRISISIGGTTGSDLGLGSLDLSTSSGAQTALDLVDAAISSLTSTRGNIGAYMNRLSYAAANLATTIENVQAAEGNFTYFLLLVF